MSPAKHKSKEFLCVKQTATTAQSMVAAFASYYARFSLAWRFRGRSRV